MSGKKRAAARRHQIAILGAILAIFGIAALYELFTDPSGRHFLHTLLGAGALPFAFFITLLGMAMIFWPQLEQRLGSYWYAEALLGLLLVYLATLSLLSVGMNAPDPFVAAVAGRGGGMVGWALAQLSLMYLGLLPTWALLLVMLAGGLYLIYLYTPLRLLTLPTILLV